MFSIFLQDSLSFIIKSINQHKQLQYNLLLYKTNKKPNTILYIIRSYIFNKKRTIIPKMIENRPKSTITPHYQLYNPQ